MENFITIKGETFKLVPVETINTRWPNEEINCFITCESVSGKVSFKILLEEDGTLMKDAIFMTFLDKNGVEEDYWDNERYIRDVENGNKEEELVSLIGRSKYNETLSVLKTAKNNGWL